MSNEQPRFLELDDAVHGRRQIAYMEARGRGPTVVWLQGFLSDMASTKATALADWARGREQALLRLDYSGHGRSSGRVEDGSMGLWLDDARQAILRLTTGPLILVGSSMGGWISLLLARDSQLEGRLAGMVLIQAAAVGVIGYGLGGAVFHAPLVSTTPGMRLDAVVTSDAGRAEYANASRYQGPCPVAVTG